VGLTTLPCKKKIAEKPPRNSAGFCGGGQGLSWAVEPRKDDHLKSRPIRSPKIFQTKVADINVSNERRNFPCA
jgi:hypothetical protein